MENIYYIGGTKGGVYMLNFNIRGENIEVTPAIREYVENKIEKVERYFSEGVSANANVNLKVYNDKQTKVEEIGRAHV